jgi:putative mRNA 3-end processing factor
MAMAARVPVIEATSRGLYCAAGDFFVDPWRPVARAVTTHAHSDHARPGSGAYLCAADGRAILADRVGQGATIETLAYGERRRMGEALVSLHPAGHILGSAQVRVEVRGEVWVVSGDYNNTAPDPRPTCAAFEVVTCDTFITESTFGLPIYRWPEPARVYEEIHRWWARNREAGVTSVLPAYPLGKSQRLLAALDPGEGPIAVHGNVARYVPLYAAAGVRMPPLVPLEEADPANFKGRGIVVTTAAAQDSPLLRRLAPLSWAFASGWMMTRAARRQRDFDRGFVLSDHADWDGLVAAIRATGARRVGVTHGATESFSRWLREEGWEAFTLETRFTGETAEEGTEAAKRASEVD